MTARFDPIEAVAGAGDLPIVLTRVGREDPAVAAGVDRIVDAAAKSRLEIVDVPTGRHGFDVLDDDESRVAISRAADLVTLALA